MKIRHGFVSNSSASSFLLYGMQMSQSAFEDAFYRLFPERKNNEDLDNDAYDMSEEMSEKTGLTVECFSWRNEVYVGRDPRKIGDDETGRKFKESTEKKIREIFGDRYKCSWIEEAWYN